MADSEDPVLPVRRTVFEDYRRRVESAERALARLDARGAWLANGRAVTFLAGLTLVVVTVFGKLPGWGYSAGVGFFVLYALLAAIHGRVLAEEERQKLTRALSFRGVQRLTHQWVEFPDDGTAFLDPAHLYAPDLDVFGRGSLFQLLDVTATRFGEARLAQWLTAAAPAVEVAGRQAAVRELAPRVDFRHGLLVEAKRVAQRKADPHAFIAWAEGEDLLAPLAWLRPVAWVFPAATFAVWLLGRFDVIPRPYVWVGIGLQLLIVALTRARLSRFYDRISAGEQGFVRFEGAFRVLEAETFTSPRMVALQHGLREHPDSVSSVLTRFGRIYGFAELRQNAQIHWAIDLLTLWDLHWFFRLEAWRKQYGRELRGWFEALAEVEALFCLATFSHERPDHVFPTVVADGPPRFIARGLGHPLLNAPVPNDVVLEGPGTAMVLTGSNMSGKSTLLRAMGANAVLAQLGAPVCAEALELTQTQVLTSMRVKDSLERGVSYFYAEVQRMKAVLDAAVLSRGHCLFLLDEILLGTNTRERQVASRGLLRRLLETGGLGAVTTHDLSLTTLEAENDARGNVHNFHFRDQLVDGQMRFDYRLRPGIVDTTNALRVLKLAGIDLPSVELES
jgi:hypothetical protein